MDTLRTLEILITSRTPLIAIETLEEDRAEQALERVAGRLRIPLFTWTMTRGLRRAPAPSIRSMRRRSPSRPSAASPR